MLRKVNRLEKNRHFQFIYKKGTKVYSKSLYIVFLPTKYKHCKAGVVVSNKLGKAVYRNKIKRRIREILRQMLKERLINEKNNYVLVAKSGIENLSFLELKNEIYHTFKKGNLLNEENN